MCFIIGTQKVKSPAFYRGGVENYSPQANLALPLPLPLLCLNLGSLLSTMTDFPGIYSELALCNHNSDYIICHIFLQYS